MLWNKALSAAASKKPSTINLNYYQLFDGNSSSTFTVPSNAMVGSLAVVSYTVAGTGYSILPSGWTQAADTGPFGSFDYTIRIIYKFITSGDLGTTVTVSNNPTSLSGDCKIHLNLFTVTGGLSTVTTSSLNVDVAPFESSNKITAGIASPCIVIGVIGNYYINGATNTSTLFSDQTYWNNIRVSSTGGFQLVHAFAHEIQNTTKTNRAVLATIPAGRSSVCISLVLTLS